MITLSHQDHVGIGALSKISPIAGILMPMVLDLLLKSPLLKCFNLFTSGFRQLVLLYTYILSPVGSWYGNDHN